MLARLTWDVRRQEGFTKIQCPDSTQSGHSTFELWGGEMCGEVAWFNAPECVLRLVDTIPDPLIKRGSVF